MANVADQLPTDASIRCYSSSHISSLPNLITLARMGVLLVMIPVIPCQTSDRLAVTTTDRFASLFALPWDDGSGKLLMQRKDGRMSIRSCVRPEMHSGKHSGPETSSCRFLLILRRSAGDAVLHVDIICSDSCLMTRLAYDYT